MIGPIGPHLTEFAPGPGFGCPPLAPFQETGPFDQGADPGEQGEALRLDEARNQGYLEGTAAAEAAFAAQVAALESQSAEHLAAERRRWAEHEGESLAILIGKGLAELESKVSATLAEILEPFLERSVRRKVTAELEASIRALLANGTSPLIQVTGPADMVEPLRAAFEGQGGVSVAAADTPEVEVLAGDTAIRSQLNAWARALEPGAEESR